MERGRPGGAAGRGRAILSRVEPARSRPDGLAVLGVVLIVALVLAGRRAAGLVPAFAGWVGRLGAWGPVAFIAGYALATVAFVPGSLLTLAAGAIFGLARGTLLVFVAATLGASLAFLIARYAARAAVERRLAVDARFAAVDRAIGAEGRRIVFLLRLSPLVPFNLLNYALGITRVRFVDYLVASIGMLPGTLLYVYSGKVAGDLAGLAAGVRRDAGYYALLGLGLLATIGATVVVTRTARRALRRSTEDAHG